jgi:hypothetical protein
VGRAVPGVTCEDLVYLTIHDMWVNRKVRISCVSDRDGRRRAGTGDRTGERENAPQDSRAEPPASREPLQEVKSGPNLQDTVKYCQKYCFTHPTQDQYRLAVSDMHTDTR